MDYVEWIDASIQVSKMRTGAVKQKGTPGKYGQTPEPGVKTGHEAGYNCHVGMIEIIVFNPTATYVRDSGFFFLRPDPEESYSEYYGCNGYLYSRIIYEFEVLILGNYEHVTEQERQ